MYSYQTAIQKERRKEFQKQLRVLFHKSPSSLLYFGSSDPLALLDHPYSKELALSYALKWGVGSLPGRKNTPFEEALSSATQSLASLVRQDQAFFVTHQETLPSTLLSSLLTRKSLLIKEPSLNIGPSFPVEVKHLSTQMPEHLSTLLSKIPSKRYDTTVILIESISSKDGSRAPLETFIRIAKETKALLVVDDTNSFGLLGKDGFGLTSQVSGIDLVFAHFGKAFGHYASFVASSSLVYDYLLQRSPLFNPPYAITPFLLGLISASLMLLPTLKSERNQITHLVDKLSSALSLQDLHLQKGPSFLLLPFANENEGKHLNAFLEENLCITHLRPPQELYTALRFSFHKNLTEQNLQQVISLFSRYKEELYCEAL